MKQTTTYRDEKIVGGPYTTAQAQLAADTYFPGMPLQYEPDVTVTPALTTGNGTLTLDFAEAHVKAGAWVVEMTAALVAKLTDPDGNVVQNAIALNNDAAIKLKIEGLGFTITDGSTPFAAGDKWTLTVAAGVYQYKANGKVAGIFYEPDSRILASPGYGTIITGGEIMEAGLVNDSGAALTLTELDYEQYRQAGFFIKKK